MHSASGATHDQRPPEPDRRTLGAFLDKARQIACATVSLGSWLEQIARTDNQANDDDWSEFQHNAETKYLELIGLLKDISSSLHLTDSSFPYPTILEHLRTLGRTVDQLERSRNSREGFRWSGAHYVTAFDLHDAGTNLYFAIRDIPKAEPSLLPHAEEPATVSSTAVDTHAEYGETAVPSSPVAGPVPSKGAGATPAKPAKYLRNWWEILKFVELPNTEQSRQRVRRLNEAYGGPILMANKGGQPSVEQDRLLNWWNGVEQAIREANQKRANQQATTAKQYTHGRDATVVPELAGSVKKRRGRRRPDNAQPATHPKSADESRRQDCGGGPTLAT